MAFHDKLSAANTPNRRLKTSHAFHCSMMDGALDRFRAAFDSVQLNSPSIPFISCVTGTWITEQQACDPGYWVSQLRAPVRFSAGVRELLKDDYAQLECGPGRTLTTLAQQQSGPGHVLIPSLTPAEKDETLAILRAAGQAWLCGIPIDAGGLFAEECPRRIPLPTYPFERRRFWLEDQHAAEEVGQQMAAVESPAGFRQPRPELAAPYVAPAQGAESAIARLFEELLGLEAVGVNDAFLDLGGDSLIAVRLANRLRDELGMEITVQRILEAGTVAMLSKCAGRAKPETNQAAALKLLETVKAMSSEQIKKALESRYATQSSR